MLLLAILGYYKLFHLNLLLFIINYFTLDYFWQFKTISIYGYLCLLVVLFIGVMGGYYIIGYWWLLY
jgi:hypothetical protein